MYACMYVSPQVERQAALLDADSVETLRQRLALLRGEWEDFRRERAKMVGEGRGMNDEMRWMVLQGAVGC